MGERNARGEFTVTMAPASGPEEPVGRMRLTKAFAGDLTATSTGEMLAFRSEAEGSAGYVAMERVTGTLDGRTGSFTLQHSGTMDRGAPTLVVSVVPDSGTEGLRELSGTMTIDADGEGHRYVLSYRLGD